MTVLERGLGISGIIIVTLLSVLVTVLIAKKSKKHTLAKLVSFFFLLALLLTWILTGGQYNVTEYVEDVKNIQGLTDIPNSLYYVMNFAGKDILFLLSLGLFYAVLSKSDGYKKVVISISEKLKGKEIVFVLIASFFITVMSTLLTNTFVVLAFVPLIISIMLNMKLDKLTAFATTFGSLFVGLMGALYGGESTYWFANYTNTSVEMAILFRLGILVVGFLLFNLFNILHVKKVMKSKKANEIKDDPFAVEKCDKDTKAWPVVVVLSILFVVFMIGYMPWSALKVTVFDSFHNWLFNLNINDFHVFEELLGNNALNEDGNFTLFYGSVLLCISALLISLVSKLKMNEFIDALEEGISKIWKPLFLFLAAYSIMLLVYFSRFIPTLMNYLLIEGKTFEPFLPTFIAMVSNLFNADLGFTAFLSAYPLMNMFDSSKEVIHTIYMSMYGFTGLFFPTSAILLFGLSYLKIEYKDWIKHIFKFLISMFIILMLLFTLMTFV